jgi:hypothetical protein
MSVEDWNGTPFQVVVTWASGEREAYTFEAKKRDTLKKAMLDVLNADTGSFSAVWNRVCKTLDARVDERGLQPDREGFTVSVDLNVDGSTPYVHGLAVVWEWDCEEFQWLNRHDLMDALTSESDSFCEIASHWMGESEW